MDPTGLIIHGFDEGDKGLKTIYAKSGNEEIVLKAINDEILVVDKNNDA